MKKGITPGEDDLQRRMEGGQRHVVADEQPAPNQRADPLDDHTELIDAGWNERRIHGRRVPQVNPDLKGLPPESNALSAWDENTPHGADARYFAP
jgi:hypothetical protein